MSWPRFGGAFPCQFLLQDCPTENRRIPRISIRYRELRATSMQHAPGRMFQVCWVANRVASAVVSRFKSRARDHLNLLCDAPLLGW